jgi:hypothetical protein
MIEVCQNRVRDADLNVQAAADYVVELKEREKAVEVREKDDLEKKTLIEEERNALEEEKSAWALIKQRIESDLATTAADRIELNVRGSLRWVLKADILRFGSTYFSAMLSFNPSHNGQYMINR